MGDPGESSDFFPRTEHKDSLRHKGIFFQDRDRDKEYERVEKSDERLLYGYKAILDNKTLKSKYWIVSNDISPNSDQ